MNTPLEHWVDRLAEEAATVKVVACFYAPDKPHYHGCLIGITSGRSLMPFFGCRTQEDVDTILQDRRLRYAAKSNQGSPERKKCGNPMRYVRRRDDASVYCCLNADCVNHELYTHIPHNSPAQAPEG